MVDIADVILKKHRDKFVRIKSDGPEDTSDLNTAMALLQYVTSSNSTVDDGFNFIPTSIEVDSCREIFKKILENMGKFLIMIR